MSKTDVKLIEGEDYAVLHNGCIRIARRFDDLGQSYQKESIPNYLSLVDHELKLEKDEYKKLLTKEETKLNAHVRQLKEHERALIIVFQGRDGAGKSGATERIIEAVDYDMEIFDAVHIGPPSDEELEHPYLWRFSIHDRMPKYGQVRVFDRSWCERLLVEPVMGITKGDELRRSYGQIRAYEWLQSSMGYLVVKFWLDITKKEQEARFKKRETKKPWKVSPDDAIARKNWNDYTSAANEMFHRTSTMFAPWYLVSSEDKRYSRVTVLQVLNEVLRENLE
jgi:polyphosphate kinase 2 (PPK2 family)